MSGIAQRWKVLSGSDNWKGLLDPLDPDLRRYLIHYATMVAPVGESLINEPASKNVGLPRYARRNLLAKTGAVKGNPFEYEVTKYLYAPSGILIGVKGYNVRPEREDVVLKESNWIGYVAVATDAGKVALGRREILVVWRGTVRQLEMVSDATIFLVNAPLIFGQDSDPLVHMGWYEMYTTINQDSVFNQKSARDQVREEVARLVELYKDEDVSITVTGHSMGSSLSTLNAVDLAVNPVNINKKDDVPITTFLFASPKVGDDKFKNAFSNQGNLRALRITDHNDPVPKLPPQLLPYAEVGVLFEIESNQSDYVRPDLDNISFHDLMLYMHGIDGFLRPQGGFEPHGDFDISKLNKNGGNLKDEYHIPKKWLVVKDNGMVQQDDGTYILDDHEPDEMF